MRNFDEHTVKFGDLNADNNEDFDHPGQSVTQQCRCYHFDLHRQHGKKLRIIDTPGFGDTRGLEQDDLNMEHIFRYLNYFSHVNAICFLLKPNASRLTSSFRSCLLQLYQMLSPNVRRNVIFCFTNARTSFYTPGDTAPLLRAMLKTLPSNDILFKKDNTFCFDNEAFRYLVALQNGIAFSELDRDEYERSWTISVNESNRMIKYIYQDLSMCSIDDRRESLQKIQEKINLIIHPMLEAMRSIFRSMISVKASPMEEMKNLVQTLSDACIEFSQFFVNMNRTTNDPIHDGLSRMIKEERKICSKLSKKLEDQKREYDERMKEFQGNPNNIDIPVLNQRIKMIEDILADPKLKDIMQDTNESNEITSTHL